METLVQKKGAEVPIANLNRMLWAMYFSPPAIPPSLTGLIVFCSSER